jgi:tetratricopeptide (TPR) repeat protein
MGLLQLMEGQPVEAARLAREAQVQAPWFYEAQRLEAEARLDQARAAQEPTQSKSALAAAGRLLAEAESRAPCDVDLLHLDMRRWQEAVALGWQSGSDPREAVLAQVAVADRWAKLEPSSAQPLAWRARARAEMARYLASRETEPAGWLSQARTDAADALQRDPKDMDACTAQASVFRTEGLRMLNQGDDPTPPLQEAIAAANRGLRIDSGHIVLQNIRNSALLYWIDTARLRGTYDRAAVVPYLQEARNLAEAHPGEIYFQGNLGGIAQAAAKAEVASGGDPTLNAEEAVKAYEKALKMQPRHVGVYRGILIARAAQAKALARDGKSPKAVVNSARKAFQQAREASVPLPTLALVFLDALVAEAGYLHAHEDSPLAVLGEASKLVPIAEACIDYPSESVAIQLRFHTLLLRAGARSGISKAREKGEALVRSVARVRHLDPDLSFALTEFHEACGNREAAPQARGQGKAVNPRGSAN